MFQRSVSTDSYSKLLRPNYKSMAATTNYCDASGSIRESNMKIARCKQQNKKEKMPNPHAFYHCFCHYICFVKGLARKIFGPDWNVLMEERRKFCSGEICNFIRHVVFLAWRNEGKKYTYIWRGGGPHQTVAVFFVEHEGDKLVAYICQLQLG